MPTTSCPHCQRTIRFELHESHTVFECAKCGEQFSPLGGAVQKAPAAEPAGDFIFQPGQRATRGEYHGAPKRRRCSTLTILLAVGLVVGLLLAAGCFWAVLQLKKSAPAQGRQAAILRSLQAGYPNLTPIEVIEVRNVPLTRKEAIELAQMGYVDVLIVRFRGRSTQGPVTREEAVFVKQDGTVDSGPSFFQWMHDVAGQPLTE